MSELSIEYQEDEPPAMAASVAMPTKAIVKRPAIPKLRRWLVFVAAGVIEDGSLKSGRPWAH
uniref:Uncharacterized protein n=1 Tax=Agrobacterium tumefaciens TaxID=358 RepID=K7XK80_AGRTU|nr:Hypothetical protein [Agrobacterium radiobacter]